MTLFLKALTFTGCLGALVATLFVGYMFLFESGSGNWISGLAVQAAVVFGGAAFGVFYLMGLASAWGLSGQKDPRFLRWFGWYTVALLVLVVLALVGRFVADEIKDLRNRQSRVAAEREGALANSILADPVKLEAYVAEKGLGTPLPGDGPTPLRGAVTKGYKDLVEKFLDKGAKVTDSALTAAVRQGDTGMLSLLLSHGKITDDSGTISAREGIDASVSFMRNNPGPTLSGQDALQEAYSQGREDILRSLISHGVQTNSLAVKQAQYGQYLQFYLGDVDWKALLKRWGDKATCPDSILESLDTAASLQQGNPVFSAEKQVVDTLNFVLPIDRLYEDPKVHFKEIQIEPWMKGIPSSGWNNSPLIRPINRALLEALYPVAIPPYSKGKGYRMFRFLVKNVRGKSGEGGKQIVRTAVSDRNVELVELLVQEGFDINVIKDELSQSSFLDVPSDRRMKEYLLKSGMVLRR